MDPGREPTLPLTQTMTVEILIAIFVWFDALSSVSTRSMPFFRHSYASLLDGENCKIKLGEYLGCKNWAMALIIKIAILNH